MNMQKFAAVLLNSGKPVLADAALDLHSIGVEFKDIWVYATEIGVQDVSSCFDETEVIDAIVALEQHCEFA